MKLLVVALVCMNFGVLGLVAGGWLSPRSSGRSIGDVRGFCCEELERITDLRSEREALTEKLAKKTQKVRAELEELVIAEPAPNRLSEQDRAEAEAAAAVAPTLAE